MNSASNAHRLCVEEGVAWALGQLRSALAVSHPIRVQYVDAAPPNCRHRRAVACYVKGSQASDEGPLFYISVNRTIRHAREMFDVIGTEPLDDRIRREAAHSTLHEYGHVIQEWLVCMDHNEFLAYDAEDFADDVADFLLGVADAEDCARIKSWLEVYVRSGGADPLRDVRLQQHLASKGYR